MWETRVWSLVWEDPLEEGTATYSNILAWRIPWTVQSRGCKELGMTVCLSLSFPNKGKERENQVQKAQRVPGRTNSRRNTLRHIVIKLTIIKDKDKILKAARKKWQITYMGTPIRLSANFSTETLQSEGNGYPVQYSCLENSMDRGQSLGLQSVRLTDYSPWGCKVSDTTEWLTLTFQDRSRINFFFTVLSLVGWHHRLNGHEFEQAPGDGEGQWSLVCCSPWGHKESDMTVWLNNKSWLCR